MYSKVLLPLDGSELAECSLVHAKQVAAKDGITEVILFRVVEPVGSYEASALVQAGFLIPEVEKRKLADAKKYLSLAAEKLNQGGLLTREEVVQGRAAESILDYAEKNKVDLIIISTHGRSGISRWAFGSVADRVVRHSNIPVLVITPTECRNNK